MIKEVLHPLDAGLLEVGATASGLIFPPRGWEIHSLWGAGYALMHPNGLRVIIDCAQEPDDRWWVHISISRASRCPSHEDMTMVKQDFLGDRYAYAVYPPKSEYVNIHKYCLHLYALVDQVDGRVLPEFSSIVMGVKSI